MKMLTILKSIVCRQCESRQCRTVVESPVADSLDIGGDDDVDQRFAPGTSTQTFVVDQCDVKFRVTDMNMEQIHLFTRMSINTPASQNTTKY
jgi:hypothetical protein